MQYRFDISSIYLYTYMPYMIQLHLFKKWQWEKSNSDKKIQIWIIFKYV